MRAPQIIMVAWLAWTLGVIAMHHGKQKEGKYNFWATLTTTGAYIAILWWGGFFG